jgi:hypothetical protein
MDPSNQTEALNPVWCIAANMVHEREYGPGGLEKREGTRHFAPGAKLYIVDFFWGYAGEQCTVVGHHRKSRRYITIVTRSKWLANWRAELVYSPHVIQEVTKHLTYKPERKIFGLWKLPEDPNWASSEAAKERAEEIIAAFSMPGRRAPDQPPVTRPPTPESNQ